MKLTAKELLDLVLADATTPKAKARLAWRMSDRMWDRVEQFGILNCREFNNECQKRNSMQSWPWVQDLWSREEYIERTRARFPKEVADKIIEDLPPQN
jgi:hypothetical protein